MSEEFITTPDIFWIVFPPLLGVFATLLGVFVGTLLNYCLQRRQRINDFKFDLTKRVAMSISTIRGTDGKFRSDHTIEELIKLLTEIEITYLYVKNHKTILSAVRNVQDALHRDKIKEQELKGINPIYHLDSCVSMLINVMMKDLGAKIKLKNIPKPTTE